MAVKIASVVKKSFADKANIKADDILLAINGNQISDVLDYMFYVSESKLEVELLRDNKRILITINKDEYDDLGLEFSSYLMDEKQSCKNKCVYPSSKASVRLSPYNFV